MGWAGVLVERATWACCMPYVLFEQPPQHRPIQPPPHPLLRRHWHFSAKWNVRIRHNSNYCLNNCEYPALPCPPLHAPHPSCCSCSSCCWWRWWCRTWWSIRAVNICPAAPDTSALQLRCVWMFGQVLRVASLMRLRTDCVGYDRLAYALHQRLQVHYNFKVDIYE